MFRIRAKTAARVTMPTLQRALRSLERGEFVAAEAELSALIERETNAAELAFLHNKRGVARIGLKHWGPAQADFLAALERRSHYAPAQTNLANLLLERGDIDAAVAQYEAAIAADPDYAIAYLNLGVAYKRAGKVAESVRALRKAQQLEARALSAGNSWPRRR